MSRALSSLDGVNEVKIDLAAGVVAVKYDPEKVSEDTLKGAITEAGYDVAS